MSTLSIDPEGLEAYFTDVEHLRELFGQALTASTLARRLLVIHGVGGIGKSSLLRMFRLHAKRVHVPVALVSGDEVKSAVDVLSNWADDLKADSVTLRAFADSARHHQAIQAKVSEQTSKALDAHAKLADLAGKAVAKTAETAASAAVGAAIGSAIPGIGTLAGAIGGMSAEALVDWLRGFLSKAEIDLLLDPTKKLTDDFLADIVRIAPKRRLVVMLDTLEHITALDDWVRDFAQRLAANVFLVIAGRAVPNWSRQWPGWLAQAQVEELRPMTEDVMRALVYRYHATMRGGEPDPAQVEAIVYFARGLPMVVTSAVKLWIQYGVEDFQAVKPQVVADLVDRLMEGVTQEMRPSLEAAAAVRWFNKEILRAVTGRMDTSAVYDDLRRFPFVRPRVEGLALHDTVREMIDENLHVHDPEHHHELHVRAAVYFESQMAKRASDDSERLGLERLYHRIRADEESGVRLFQEMAEQLTRYRLIIRLRSLMNDVGTYLLENENSRLWRRYYGARLMHLQLRYADAEKVYEVIAESDQAEQKLRAYALCDWGKILARYERLGQVEGVEKATQTLEKSLKLGGLDFHLNQNFFRLARVARYKGEWDKQAEYLKKAQEFFEQQGDAYGLAYVYSEVKRANGIRGIWSGFFDAHERGLATLAHISPQPHALKATLIGEWAWAFCLAGRLAECEQNARTSLSIVSDLQDNLAILHTLGDLGWTLAAQGRLGEADECFNESFVVARQSSESEASIEQGSIFGGYGATLCWSGRFEKAQEYLTQSLKIKESLHDVPGMQEPLSWLGLLAELQDELTNASSYYQKCLEYKWYGRYYFECVALTGLVRIKYAQGDYPAVAPLLAVAEQLAQQYEYNDHLTSLRLTQGHAAWESHIPEWGNSFEDAFHYYQRALTHALRYNRFLLDEALSGRPQGTPLHPIIRHCLERSEEGRRMLIALRDWWLTGVNDLGTSRPSTISPIPNGFTLLEAEHLARQREPGDGKPQKTVIEQIDAALAAAWGEDGREAQKPPSSVSREDSQPRKMLSH